MEIKYDFPLGPKDKSYKLPALFVDLLVKSPENGMGYQIVDLYFKNEKEPWENCVVLNCEHLFLPKGLHLDVDTIDKIVMSKK